VIATALLQLVVLEPTRAEDVTPDECRLASVYSTLSEETTSGQDTGVNDRTAAHRSLPFGTLPNGCIAPNSIGLLSRSVSVFSGSKGKTPAHWDEFAKLATLISRKVANNRHAVRPAAGKRLI
jgi:hypothetical protein